VRTLETLFFRMQTYQTPIFLMHLAGSPPGPTPNWPMPSLPDLYRISRFHSWVQGLESSG